MIPNSTITCLNGSSQVLPQIPESLQWRIAQLKKLNLLNPDNREIKENLLFFSTIYFYSSVPLLLSKRSLIVMGKVFDDGVGDYYHILNAAEWIKSKFPKLNVSMLISHMDAKLPSVVRKPFDPQIEACFFNSDEIPANVYFMLQQSDHIIEMSQKIRDQEIEEIINYKRDRYRFIGEYGYSSKHPMGLKFDHLGIIIKDKAPTDSLLFLKNGGLKHFLFGTDAPSMDDVDKYLSTHEPYIAYLKVGSYYQTGFIYTTAALFRSSPKQTIDLILPKIKMEYLHTGFLKDQGIAKIKVIKIKKEQVFKEEFILAKEGKELRLIDPFPLEQVDFYTLLNCTNPLVGCTGDHSITEAISFNRVPFYELRTVKKVFMSHLIMLSKYIGKSPFYLKQYFEELANIYDPAQSVIIDSMKTYDELPDEASKKQWQKPLLYLKKKQPQIAASALKIANLLQQPELINEVRNLNMFLRVNFSFNPLLQNIVERQLALSTFKDLKKLEKKVRENYLEDNITLDEALGRLVERIQMVNSLGV